MIFIINGRVKFNEYEGTLESVNACNHAAASGRGLPFAFYFR